MQASMICKYFARGYCRNSQRCSFMHIQSTNGAGSTRLISISAQRKTKQVCFPLKVLECHRKPNISEEVSMHTIGSNFSLMTWNVLADSYINYSFYPYCPFPAMKWNYRRDLILNAIQDKTPDIICMQELEDYAWFKNTLAALGYQGLFKQRTRGRTDGCAIFYQDNKFKLVKTGAVELNKFSNADPDMQKLNEFFNNYNRGLAQDRNKKDCVALFAMLQPISNESNSSSESEESHSELMSDKNDKPITESDASRKNFYESLYGFKKDENSTEESEDKTQNNNDKKKKTKRIRKNSVAEEICIATTHIYWNPKYIDVKMKQIKQVLLHLAQFNPSLRNTILCGDFNSTPTSGLYQFVRNGQLDLSQYTPADLDERAVVKNTRIPKEAMKIDQSEKSNGLKRKSDEEKNGLPRKRIHLMNSDESDSSEYEESSSDENMPDLVIRHPFKFKSAYEQYTENEFEPQYTSYFRVFKGTVDYIFYTEDLVRTHVLELPHPDLLKKLGGVPHNQWPSDHLALFSHFNTRGVVSVNNNNTTRSEGYDSELSVSTDKSSDVD